MWCVTPKILDDGTMNNSQAGWCWSLINRILYKVQKSFWSCTHVNSCQNYALYINLHILLNILCKTTLNIQELRKSIKRLKT